MLWDLQHREADLKTQRKGWAEKLRAPIRNHPKAWDWISRPGKKKAVSANRRAGKTETTGRESAARAIENDNYEVWVFAGDFSEYSKNWLMRRPDGLIKLLEEMGLEKGDTKDPKDFRVERTGSNVKAIVFDRWNSAINVFSAKDSEQIQKARGGRMDLLIVDEAQKLPVIQELLLEIVGPASIDRKGSFWLLGTPGKDIDSFFCRISQGVIRGWDLADFYNWDNPSFGSTFDERYRNSALYYLDENKDEFGINEEQWDFLAKLDEAGALSVYESELGKTLPESILREWFGVWIADQAGLVFGSVKATKPWWGSPWAPKIDRRHRNRAIFQDLLDEPKLWKERFQQLPKRTVWGKPRDKQWRAIIGSDFGMKVDPFALVVWLESSQDKAIYELGSGRALDLGEDEQATILEHWVHALKTELGISTKYIIVDASGGAAASTQKTWNTRFQQRFSVPVFDSGKFDKRKDQQIWMFNADVRRGQIKFLENSPLSVEMEHLQWRFTKAGKREIHKYRKATLGKDGSRVVLGDNCCDAARYSWYFANHLDSRDWVEPEDPYDSAVIQRKMDEVDFSTHKKPGKSQKVKVTSSWKKRTRSKS